MRLADAAEVRRAVQAHLKSHQFTDTILAVYAEKGIAPENVALPAEIYRGTMWAPQNFPCGEVTLVGGVRESVETLGLTDKTYTVPIYWHVNGTDEEIIEDETNYLVRAVEDYFESRGTLLPFLENASVWLGNEDYSPVVKISGETQPLIKSGMITLFVRVGR